MVKKIIGPSNSLAQEDGPVPKKSGHFVSPSVDSRGRTANNYGFLLRASACAPAPRVGALSAERLTSSPFPLRADARQFWYIFMGAHRIVLDHICPAGKRQESYTFSAIDPDSMVFP